jgi:DNA-binding CsgD family transcriptional regulator
MSIPTTQPRLALRPFFELAPFDCELIPLSGRETEVLQLIANGNRNEDVAVRLGIAVDTVKTHLRGILLKLGAANRAHAAAIGIRQGFVS